MCVLSGVEFSQRIKSVGVVHAASVVCTKFVLQLENIHFIFLLVFEKIPSLIRILSAQFFLFLLYKELH